jgi:GNAT superfamily N-acetyltransferase
MNSECKIAAVACSAVRPLRAAILRPGRPAHESVYSLDDHPDAAHFGAVAADGEIVGSASVFRQPADANDPHVPDIDGEHDSWRGADAWRLRGMTVVERMRGSGCGAALLRAVIDHVARRDGQCLWFHARASARGFYERFGFIAIGPTYDSPHIGEHVFMWRTIATSKITAPRQSAS